MSHDHSHHSAHANNKKILWVSFIIISAYMFVEAIGGWLTNSLALLSDAGHMFSDAVSLGLALLAFKFGERAASEHRTYGYKRFEILAAMAYGLSLLAIALLIFYEAIWRFIDPPVIATTGMLVVSIIGLLVNLFVAYYMLKGSDTQSNLNMRGAYLHVLGDLFGSVGAIAAAVLIIYFGWNWADPLASVLVAILVFRSGWHISRDSIHVLMEGVPKEMELKHIAKSICEVEGVLGVHDIHLWTITSGLHALSCHIVVSGSLSVIEAEVIQNRVAHMLEHQDIAHSTIQAESEGHQHGDELLCAIHTHQSDIGHGHHHH